MKDSFIIPPRNVTREPLIKSSGSRVSDEMSLYASCRFRVDIRDSRPGSAAPQMGSYRRNPKGRGFKTSVAAPRDLIRGSLQSVLCFLRHRGKKSADLLCAHLARIGEFAAVGLIDCFAL